MKLLIAFLVIFSGTVLAWEPTKPVTVIIGNAPGGGNEIAFRKLASIVAKTNKDLTFIVRNMPGADGVVSMNAFVTSPADGYTISIPAHMNTFVTNDIWEKDIKKFEQSSFIPVLTIGKSPLVLVANIKSKVNTPTEFIKLLVSTTKPINLAGGGGAHRMTFEYIMFKGNGNKDLASFVKFQGPAQAMVGVANESGDIEFGIVPITIAKPLIDAGKIKPIGFTGTKKMPQYPDVPLINATVPGTNVYGAWSLILPSDTPQEIVDWYLTTFVSAVQSAEYKEWAEQNLIFVEPKELSVSGVRQQIEDLRATFLPLAKNMKP